MRYTREIIILHKFFTSNMAKPIRFLHTDDYNETKFNVRYEWTNRKYERIKQRLEQITRVSKKYRKENHN